MGAGLRGLESTIVFGVRKEAAGELKGHAWLEHEGQPIFEPAPPAYTVTYEDGDARPRCRLKL